MRRITLTEDNYLQIIAIKEDLYLKDRDKNKKLIQLFMTHKLVDISLSKIFDVYRNLDTTNFKKTRGDQKKIVGYVNDAWLDE